jgi:GNAT superfamily N-acetyltransferase
VGPVPASSTWALRRAVLRPHQSASQVAREDLVGAIPACFGAVTETGVVVGVVRVALERPRATAGLGAGPFPPWRLRGMATRPDLRDAGIGSWLLGCAVDHVAARGGGLLWCTARAAAVNLYRRAGFAQQGDPWDAPVIGPHVLLWQAVPADGSGRPNTDPA